MMLQEVAIYTSIAVDCIAISGAAFAIWRFRKDLLDRQAKQDEKLKEEALLDAKRRKEEEEIRIKNLRLDEVADWGKRCIHQLRLGHHYHSANIEDDRVIEFQAKLSALIDEGRLYFKNLAGEKLDEGKKAEAFRGFRPTILDPLVASYQVDNELKAKTHSKQDLLKAFRLAEQDFVSLLQAEVGRATAKAEVPASAGSSSPLKRYLEKVKSAPPILDLPPPFR